MMACPTTSKPWSSRFQGAFRETVSSALHKVNKEYDFFMSEENISMFSPGINKRTLNLGIGRG